MRDIKSKHLSVNSTCLCPLQYPMKTSSCRYIATGRPRSVHVLRHLLEALTILPGRHLSSLQCTSIRALVCCVKSEAEEADESSRRHDVDSQSNGAFLNVNRTAPTLPHPTGVQFACAFHDRLTRWTLFRLLCSFRAFLLHRRITTSHHTTLSQPPARNTPVALPFHH